MEATPTPPARKPGAVIVPSIVDSRKAEHAKLDTADKAAREATETPTASGEDERARKLRDLERQAGVPMTYCRECDAGPFCVVAERQRPHLCINCAAGHDRAENGWTPENSID